MILINLLPQEFRVRKGPAVKVPYKLIAVGAFFVFLLLSLVNLYVNLRVRGLHRRLQSQWEKIEPLNMEAHALEADLGTSVLAEVQFYDTFVDPPLETAHILNLISDLIPQSLTLRELKFERHAKEFKLTLDGISESTERKSELVQIQDYANGLKNRMESFLKPATETESAPSSSIKADVTTSTKQDRDTPGVVTEFKAILRTEGFETESF